MTGLKLVLCQFLLRLVLISGFGINLIQLPRVDRSRVVCPLALLYKYFHSGDPLSGSVVCMSLTPHNRDVQEQVVVALHQHENSPWTVLLTQPQSSGGKPPTGDQQLMHEKPQCYFIIVGDLDDVDLEEIFENWKRMVNWNPFAQFVVFLSAVEETDEEMTDLMVELMLNFMNHKLYNVNVLGQSEENSFYYGKTVFPYHPDNNCGNRVIAVDLLDACSYEEDDEQEEAYEEEEEDEEEKEDEDEEQEYEEHKSSQLLSKRSVVYELEDSSERRKVGVPELEEYMSAKFQDKFPHDLSGCPIRAAYRGPWEPYIFTELQPEEQINYEYPMDEEGGVAGNESETSYGNSYSDSNDYDEQVEDHAAGNSQTEPSLGSAKLAGLEFHLVETIASQLHVDINFQAQSSNVFHLFQQLIEGQIDVIVGGIDEDPSISQFVSSSTSYHQDELTWCVAKAQRKHSFFNFLASFNAFSLLLLLLFIMSSSMTVLVSQWITGCRITSLQNYLSICIRMLGILLTQSIGFDALRMPLVMRFSFILAFYMAFFFSNTYQSFLISTLTTPTTLAQISHLEEIYGNRMTIMVTSENVRHLDKEGEIFRYIREKFQICYNIVECLNQAALDDHLAVAVSRQHALYNARIQRDRLYCFDRRESLYVYPVVMLLPKKFQLLQQINAIIQNVIESGHMQKWARDLDMVRLIHEKIASAQANQDFKALNLEQFRGAFAFAYGLLGLATSVFLLEWFIYWTVVKRRSRLKILRCLHRRFRIS